MSQATMPATAFEVLATDRPLARRLHQLIEREATNAGHGRAGALALVTWDDMVAFDAPTLVQALGLDSRPAPVVVAVVPWNARRTGAHFTYDFPVPDGQAASTSQTHVEAMLAALRTALRADDRLGGLLFTPTFVAPDIDEATGYPSLTQALVRTATAVCREVRSKVPAYFERFPLVLPALAPGEVSVTTEQQFAGLLLRYVEQAGAAARDGVGIVHSPLSSQELALAIEGGLGLRIESRSSMPRLNSVDDVYSASMVARPQAEIRIAANDATVVTVRTDSGSPCRGALQGLAAAPLAPWETSYRHISHVSIAHVPELRVATCGSLSAHYLSGGTGPAIVMLPPYGADPGYFAELARELLTDHRVILWDPSGSDPAGVTADLAQLRQVCAEEQLSAVHLVTWCGGTRLAAALAHALPSVVRSVTLFAPELPCATPTVVYRALARVFERFAVPGADIDRLAVGAKEMWMDWIAKAKDDDIESYDPERGTKSPFQKHPAVFFSKATAELFDDPRCIVKMAEAANSTALVTTACRQIDEYVGPVLVVSGTADSVIDYSFVAGMSASRARWTLATVVGGNHYALLEHGRALGDVIRQFVRGRSLASDPSFGRRGRLRVAGGPVAVESTAHE